MRKRRTIEMMTASVLEVLSRKGPMGRSALRFKSNLNYVRFLEILDKLHAKGLVEFSTEDKFRRNGSLIKRPENRLSDIKLTLKGEELLNDR